MSIPQLSETSLRRNAGAQTFKQGKACYESGAIVGLTRRGSTLQANVEGNQAELYRVSLSFDDGGLTVIHWVINNARRRAEEIIDAGKAKAYHHAADWLKKMRAAYLASERQAQWSAYRARLMEKTWAQV